MDLTEGAGVVGEEHDAETAGDAVEGSIGKGEGVDVGNLEIDVRQRTVRGAGGQFREAAY